MCNHFLQTIFLRKVNIHLTDRVTDRDIMNLFSEATFQPFNCSFLHLFKHKLNRFTFCTTSINILNRVPKLATPLASNKLNLVCSSWISTKYRTLHYLNITYCHTYYDIRTLQCVLSVTSLWCQSLQTVWDELDQRIIDKAIKQWRTRPSACVEAKGGPFEHKL